MAVAVRIALLLLAVMSAAAVARADDGDYLFGYIDALLDNRFPGLGLRAVAIDPQGGVQLAGDTCLGPWQRRDVARLLQRTGRVQSVLWDRTTDCAPTPSDQAQPERTLPVRVQVLPEQSLFAPLIADPRQPQFSMSYQRYDTSAQSFNAASVAFGEYFGFARRSLGQGTAQIGIQAAVFALFNLDAPSHDLINADYWIGLPLTFRRGPWSYLVRVYHQSSHLGDEFILGNPGINRVNLSYENAEGLVSYEWERWRIYGGGGYILHSEPTLRRGSTHTGVEFIQPDAVHGLDFVAAVDGKASAELGWRWSTSYEAGFEFGRDTRRLRLMLEYYRGHSPNGQFYEEHLRYRGIGLYFGF